MEKLAAMENINFVLLKLPQGNFCNAFRNMYSSKEEPAKFWILFQQISELISMMCFFWRVSIFCFSFNKLFTFLPSQSSIHLLHLRQWIGEAACLKLFLGMAIGCCYSQCPLIAGWDWIKWCSWAHALLEETMPQAAESRTLSLCPQHYISHLCSCFPSP